MKQILITRDQLHDRLALHAGMKCGLAAKQTNDIVGGALMACFIAEVIEDTLNDLFGHSCNSADDNIFKEKEG